MARRPGDVDRASRLAPLAAYLERHGFVPVRDAMVLYGTKRRDEVLAFFGWRAAELPEQRQALSAAR